ncbi:alkaline phosphatase family protein [Rhodococcus maanshanensis]|uniref:Type I phosphodiesterase / nucleotide pyrophosphatase n=1 Tax=Rhodococcus maanshanensis TaxID=183556 RepID=A0A1H7Q288_9NOCA|nr:alkaline phosphatase family protein [Rhodococcus maanshanensis]SEL41929.1 Type I phosphodiesterase / nucleotide pyrophosphatase [Rhodococcus maanshanensis]
MTTKRTRTLTALSIAIAGAVSAGTATAAASPTTPESNDPAKVVVIGLDGTMLDHIKTANTPNLHRLMAEGTTGSSSILGHPTISGPSWSTMLTGVWNTKHGVQDNSFNGARFDQYPTAFTQIERADPALRTEAISTWGGIATIAGSGSPTADVVTTTPDAGSEGATDTATATAVANEIAGNGPDFVFTQLDQVDGAGHATGTLGPAYNLAIEAVDLEVGRIVAAVDERQRNTGERWTVLVTADHGHRPLGGHGGQTPAEASTFVIVRGGGYRAGGIDNGYTMADIAPTVLEILGVPRPANLDGTALAKDAPVPPPVAGGSTGAALPSWVPTGS